MKTGAPHLPLLTTLSLRAGEQPGAIGSLTSSNNMPPRMGIRHMPVAFVALLAANLFVVFGAVCFSFLYFYR